MAEGQREKVDPLARRLNVPRLTLDSSERSRNPLQDQRLVIHPSSVFEVANRTWQPKPPPKAVALTPQDNDTPKDASPSVQDSAGRKGTNTVCLILKR